MVSKACVIGLGYIGLPVAGLMAHKGILVHGVDKKREVVDLINAGKVNIIEPKLDELIRGAVLNGALKASDTPEEADVFIICVPTPFTKDKNPDLSYVMAATRSIVPFLRPGNVVVLESTSPVGTTEEMADLISNMRTDLAVPLSGNNMRQLAALSGGDKSNLVHIRQIAATSDFGSLPIYIAYCPERVIPGNIIHELACNDRVIGGINEESAAKAGEFYSSFVRGQIIKTDARTAELCKLVENSFRDVNIAFANELSLICDEYGVNVWELIGIANHHPRVSILQPGPGVGGHCIAVDPWFIINAVPNEARLLRMAREINDARPDQVVEQVKSEALRWKKPTIACLGMSFKAGTGDFRESPAVKIIKRLAQCEAGKLVVVDPYFTRLPAELFGLSSVEKVDLTDALVSANIVLLLVDHPAFAAIDDELLLNKSVIDTRGLWQRNKVDRKALAGQDCCNNPKSLAL